jgi:antitoxin component of RelBE/YafQ-DinJ toxin-antitoxin module
MSRLTFEIDDVQLQEVSRILDSVGLDLDIAFNIFIKKIIKEKGLPFAVKQNGEPVQHEMKTKNEDEIRLEAIRSTRSNNSITSEMVEEVWSAFTDYQGGLEEVKVLAYLVSLKSGMNLGSATIYLNILIKLSKGEINRRSMKTSDFEFFLKKFKEKFSDEMYKNAIESVKLSIPYWKSNIPTFAEGMELLLSKIEGE